jgi:two-component system, LytTR family, response regulator AlgR
MNDLVADAGDPAAALDAIRVLVIDDDQRVGGRLRELLGDFGHLVVGLASNGIQALVLIKTLRPDVVVSDLRMPGMSGLQVATEVQRLDAPPAIIIVSAYDDLSLKEQASQAGVAAYLVKGAPGEQIHDAVVAVNAARRLLRARP